LGHWGFGFVSHFVFRISDLPGSSEPGRLALFSAVTPLSSPRTPRIGFVWRAGYMPARISYIESAIRLARLSSRGAQSRRAGAAISQLTNGEMKPQMHADERR
jgi:hypothetical protein